MTTDIPERSMLIVRMDPSPDGDGMMAAVDMDIPSEEMGLHALAGLFHAMRAVAEGLGQNVGHSEDVLVDKVAAILAAGVDTVMEGMAIGVRHGQRVRANGN